MSRNNGEKTVVEFRTFDSHIRSIGLEISIIILESRRGERNAPFEGGGAVGSTAADGSVIAAIVFLFLLLRFPLLLWLGLCNSLAGSGGG